MCFALADCIPSRCNGQLDSMHVDSYGDRVKLIGEQDGGDFFSYLSICHAWLGAFYRKFVFGAPRDDAWGNNDCNGFRDEEFAAGHFR